MGISKAPASQGNGSRDQTLRRKALITLHKRVLLGYIPGQAEAAVEIAAKATHREKAVVRVEMIQRDLFNKIGAET